MLQYYFSDFWLSTCQTYMPKATDGHGGCLPFLWPTFGYKRNDVIMDYTFF